LDAPAQARIAGVARALKPHGRLVGEFGGHGNVAGIATALRPSVRCMAAIRPGSPPGSFPRFAEYRRLLEQGGFTIKSIVLMPCPTPLEIGMQGWLQTFGRSFFEQFEEPERSEVLAEVLDLLRPALCNAGGVWTADHIRLRFFAERSASGRAPVGLATSMPDSWRRPWLARSATERYA
jgi:hypothetical protein